MIPEIRTCSPRDGSKGQNRCRANAATLNSRTQSSAPATAANITARKGARAGAEVSCCGKVPILAICFCGIGDTFQRRDGQTNQVSWDGSTHKALQSCVSGSSVSAACVSANGSEVVVDGNVIASRNGTVPEANAGMHEQPMRGRTKSLLQQRYRQKREVLERLAAGELSPFLFRTELGRQRETLAEESASVDCGWSSEGYCPLSEIA